MASVPKPNVSAERQMLHSRMDKHNLAPLWEVLHDLIPSEPSTPCKPALWKYRDVRPYLMEAGKLITAKEASAVEVATAHLDRIAAVDERVHAFLHVDREGALAAAAAGALELQVLPDDLVDLRALADQRERLREAHRDDRGDPHRHLRVRGGWPRRPGPPPPRPGRSRPAG